MVPVIDPVYIILYVLMCRMASVFETYEQQFATITADITARIGKIPNLVGSKLINSGYKTVPRAQYLL